MVGSFCGGLFGLWVYWGVREEMEAVSGEKGFYGGEDLGFAL